jgi:hypothetical protein
MSTLLVLLFALLLLTPTWAEEASAGAPVEASAAAENGEETDSETSAETEAPEPAEAEAEEPAEVESNAEEEEEEEAAPVEWIYFYEDGCVIGYSAPEDFEMYAVEREDIRSGNFELIKSMRCDCPRGHPGQLVVGIAQPTGDADAQTEHYGPRPEGLTLRDGQWRRRMGMGGDWQELRADYAAPGSYTLDYDSSALRDSWDINSFARDGWVYGLRTVEGEDEDTEERISTGRQRNQTDLTYRNGSMEGGSWRFNLRHYDLELGAAEPIQPRDSTLTRAELRTRYVECNTAFELAGYAGQYESARAQLDNDFVGVKFDGSHWLGERVELQADGQVTSIDAALQAGGATRSDYHASLGWDANDELRLTAFTRAWNEDNDISAGTRLTGYRDLGARADWQPDSRTSASVSIRHREADLERLRIEAPEILLFFRQFDPPPTREELAGLRTDAAASGDQVELQARHRFSDDVYAGLSLEQEQFDTLPPTGEMSADELAAPYLPDKRSRGSVHAAWDFGCRGNFTFRASGERRENTERDSRYRRGQYSLGYTAPICERVRLGLAATHQQTSIDVPSDTEDFDGSGWNYTLTLSGSRHDMDYRVSASHGDSEAHSGGEFNGLGLELDFKSPWRMSAWWREYQGYFGGLSSSDAGLEVGYRVEL